MLSEFAIIKKYFQDRASYNQHVLVGSGDDCAIVNIPNEYELCITTDTLVADKHFFANQKPYTIAYKAIQVNLSDLAAMGALPKFVTVCATLPEVNEPWLQEFANGLFDSLATQKEVSLIGGDATSGPLSITVTAMGFIEKGKHILRNAAKPNDLICVTGTLGEGAYGLFEYQKDNDKQSPAIKKYLHANSRCSLGRIIKDYANAMIDISDGLTGDLNHILQASKVGAMLDFEKIPLSDYLISNCGKAEALNYALHGGDDYELLFTITKDKYEQLKSKVSDITAIGTITAGNSVNFTVGSFEHKF